MDRNAFVEVMNEASGMLDAGRAPDALARLTAFDDGLTAPPDPKDYGWIVSYRFRSAFAAGEFEQALRIAEQGPARFPADIPPATMASMYSMAVEAATQLDRADSAVTMADRCIELRRAHADHGEVLMAAMTACTLLGDIERHDLASRYARLLVAESDGYDEYRAYGYYGVCAAIEHGAGPDLIDLLRSGRAWLTSHDIEFARVALEYLDHAAAVNATPPAPLSFANADPFAPANPLAPADPFNPANPLASANPAVPAEPRGTADGFAPAEPLGVVDGFAPAEPLGAVDGFAPGESFGAGNGSAAARPFDAVDGFAAAESFGAENGFAAADSPAVVNPFAAVDPYAPADSPEGPDPHVAVNSPAPADSFDPRDRFTAVEPSAAADSFGIQSPTGGQSAVVIPFPGVATTPPNSGPAGVPPRGPFAAPESAADPFGAPPTVAIPSQGPAGTPPTVAIPAAGPSAVPPAGASPFGGPPPSGPPFTGPGAIPPPLAGTYAPSPADANATQYLRVSGSDPESATPHAQPPAEMVAGGETADALLDAQRPGIAAAAYRALIDDSMASGKPDPLIVGKAVLGLLMSLIFDNRVAEAHEVWIDEQGPTHLGIWALENGQTSVHDGIAYNLVAAYLHSLSTGDRNAANHAVDTLMGRCVDWASGQDPMAVPPMLNTWRRHLREIHEGEPAPEYRWHYEQAAQRWAGPIPEAGLYWMRPYHWHVDWL
ncbi:hypothetical protein LTV02_13515 [Nocardia yamanashiensis]|uniref:hypothetical protein n=1 Tax=Nocardia yamanashiensis TaxID=209247 RepID=UPI001E40F9C2|nr:hypothetical protein [Nocardia yamanashiensis]UGT44345.1 hypothetical protein LTV02_13515 [Nocardia yamanashiensis]